MMDDYWRPELQHKVKFRTARAMDISRAMDIFGYYYVGDMWIDDADVMQGLQEHYVIVGKVRPWDEEDDEYVLYGDGGFWLAKKE